MTGPYLHLSDDLLLAAATNVASLFLRNPEASSVQVVDAVLRTLTASGYSVIKAGVTSVSERPSEQRDTTPVTIPLWLADAAKEAFSRLEWWQEANLTDSRILQAVMNPPAGKGR